MPPPNRARSRGWARAAPSRAAAGLQLRGAKVWASSGRRPRRSVRDPGPTVGLHFARGAGISAVDGPSGAAGAWRRVVGQGVEEGDVVVVDLAEGVAGAEGQLPGG
ncbi:hypothetical protein GCM10020229_10110 [Kitasatospora albolonga]